MSKNRDVIADAVVTAISKANTDETTQVTRDSQLPQGLDSIALMIAFADIQAALRLEFEPEHLLQLFLCPSIADMVTVIAPLCGNNNP